jgi:histidinol-phosphate aminotransferase
MGTFLIPKIMIRIPDNIQELTAYKPGKSIEQIVEELNLTKTAVLWNNENNFGCSPKAKIKMAEAMDHLYLYSDPLSTPLRTQIARENGIQPEQVVVGNGSEGIMQNLMRAFCKGDDEVLTFQGTFVIIYVWSMLNDTPCKKVPLTDAYGFDLNPILEQITDKTKVIYLSNPNNPTGAMISEKALRDFMTKVPEHILVVIDEAYYEYASVITAEYPDSIRMNYSNVLTLRTFSKAYGLAGMRVGYAMGHVDLIEPLMRVKLTFEPSSLAQAAGEGALEDVDFLANTVQNNKEQLPVFYKAFDEMSVTYVPSFANFVMIDIGTPEKATQVFEDLLKKGVFVRVLAAFGLPHCIRITVGTPEENAFCIEMMKEVLN